MWRLGDWPKDFSDYERLSAALFLEFRDELQGVEGVEKWNLKSFGSGKATVLAMRTPLVWTSSLGSLSFSLLRKLKRNCEMFLNLSESLFLNKIVSA